MDKDVVHIHNGILTMKRNAFESVLMRWLNLEPIIQSKVSQKEKDKYHLLMHIIAEKAMAPHSSTLAWKIPWMEEPGGLQSMRSLKSQTQLSTFTFIFHFHALEKEMATHSRVLACRIPGTREPGGLPSMGSHRVRHD